MQADRRKAKATAGPANPVIPDKLYFRIGEVAALLGVQTYVLRFWEAEFPQLSPTKSGSGHRLYRRRDVEAALRIKRLLYSEGYTIAGAKTLLRTEVRERQPELPLPVPDRQPNSLKLNRLRAEMEEVASMLARPLPGTRKVPKPERKAGHGKQLAEPVRKADAVQAILAELDKSTATVEAESTALSADESTA